MRIDYKGYTVSQSLNNHVMITKGNEIVLHMDCTRRLTQVELIELVECYLKLVNQAESGNYD